MPVLRAQSTQAHQRPHKNVWRRNYKQVKANFQYHFPNIPQLACLRCVTNYNFVSQSTVSPRYGSIMTPKIFFHFHHHDSLFVVPTRTTSHLVSSLHRNFGTRSLNRENSEVAFYKQMPHSFYSMSW